MNSRALFLLLAVGLGLFALTGCSSDNNEHQRLVTEADIVNGGAPVIVAGVNVGSPSDPNDDFVPIEFVSVLFSARPLNDTMVIPEDGTYSSFNVTSYDLVWNADASGPPELSAYNVSRGNLTLNVPIYNEAMASVLVGNMAMKAEAWFPTEVLGGPGPFTANLDITFYGHESSSEHEVAIHAGTTVQFLAAISDE